MTIILDGSQLTIEKMVHIARHGEMVELHPEALERIRLCRAMLEEKIQAHEIMYGVNTGIGEFSEVVLTDEQVAAVLTYIRRDWGQAGTPVAPATVSAMVVEVASKSPRSALPPASAGRQPSRRRPRDARRCPPRPAGSGRASLAAAALRPG